MLDLQHVSYDYNLLSRCITIFKDVTYSFSKGSFTSIQAPSGSGKTTLLNLLGLLDKPTKGKYFIDSRNTSIMTDTDKSQLRAEMFGFLFQNFRLIPNKSVMDNITLSLDIAGIKDKGQKIETALMALEHVGLSDRINHLPPELSGGEAQRVAFARAMAKQPKVLLADEPTGNLDQTNRDRILNLISEFHASGGTVIMVTHDPIAAQRAKINLYLYDLYDSSTHENV